MRTGSRRGGRVRGGRFSVGVRSGVDVRAAGHGGGGGNGRGFAKGGKVHGTEVCPLRTRRPRLRSGGGDGGHSQRGEIGGAVTFFFWFSLPRASATAYRLVRMAATEAPLPPRVLVAVRRVRVGLDGLPREGKSLEVRGLLPGLAGLGALGRAAAVEEADAPPEAISRMAANCPVAAGLLAVSFSSSQSTPRSCTGSKI